MFRAQGFTVSGFGLRVLWVLGPRAYVFTLQLKAQPKDHPSFHGCLASFGNVSSVMRGPNNP